MRSPWSFSTGGRSGRLVLSGPVPWCEAALEVIQRLRFYMWLRTSQSSSARVLSSLWGKVVRSRGFSLFHRQLLASHLHWRDHGEEGGRLRNGGQKGAAAWLKLGLVRLGWPQRPLKHSINVILVSKKGNSRFQKVLILIKAKVKVAEFL